MELTDNHPSWMDDELVKEIPQQKLDFLSQLFIGSKGKTQKEMMSFFLPMLKKAKAENIILTQAEITACIQAIKKNSSEEELDQINRLLAQHKK